MRRVPLLFGLFLLSCQAREEASTYVYRRTPDGGTIRTEMRHGSANGRLIAYRPNGEIAAIMHVRDSVLTGPTYSFYPGGQVAQITPYTRGFLHGVEYRFSEQGTLQSTETYVEDEKTGLACGYYPTGSLRYRATWWRGQARGEYLDFYKVPANQVRRRTTYVLVRGKQWANGYDEYSPAGVLTKRVDQVSATFNKPRYTLRDTVVLTLQLLGPQFPRLKATITDTDSLFNGPATAASQVVYGHGGVIQVHVRPSQAGVNYVRGYVTDYDSSASVRQGVQYQMKEKDIYFQQRYWVN